MSEKTDDKKDEKLVAVGDGAEVETEIPGEEAQEKSSRDTADETIDGKVGHAEESEEEGEGTTDEEGREAIRERRRAERKQRRQREASNRRELNFLRQRNESLERRQSELAARQDQQEVLSIDQRIGQIEGQIREADSIHSEAITKNDGTTATEAMKVRNQLEAHKAELLAAKKEKATDKAEPAPARAVGPPPEAVVLGQKWLRENDWFDPKLEDEDSYLTRAIEERLAREGELSPTEPEYWEELSRRIAKRLPDVVKRKKPSVKKDDIFDEDDGEGEETPAPKRKAKGPVFSVGGRSRSLKPNEVFINAERRKALEEAGVWDDPERRERYLNSYKRYDDEALKNS